MSRNATLDAIRSYRTRHPLPEAPMSSTPESLHRAPSDKQIELIKKLLDQLAELAPQVAQDERETLNAMYAAHMLTGGREGTASQRIDHLMSLVKSIKNSRAVRPTVPAGHYAVTASEGHTAFYRVTVSGKDFYTVELQVSDEHRILPWTIAQSVLRQIEQDGIVEASIRYGRELGVCGVCGRALTNEESRAAGIGPICRSRLAG